MRNDFEYSRSEALKLFLNLIRMANLIPYEVDIEPFNFYFHELDKGTEEKKRSKIKQWIELVKNYPLLAKEFGLDINALIYEPDFNIQENIIFYHFAHFQFILKVRELMFQIVALSENENISINPSTYHPLTDLFLTLKIIDGKFRFEMGSFAKIIEGLEAKRLKRCVICRNIFWANRIDKANCSKKCSNVHQQRTIRTNPLKLNEVNKRRRNNYAYKQASTKQKEKK